MNPLLGLRIALAGGREAVARMALMAIGVAVGVILILISLTALPIMQSHVDRLAWHRTDAASTATAPDPALWLAVTDRHSGRDIVRVQVAALGPRPPVPPGVDRLPAPGEVFASPALAELIRTTPRDQLGDRFPGRVTGSIAPAGLVRPDELVAIVGRTPGELRGMRGVTQVRGIEQPGERLDLYGMYRVLVGMLAALIIGPVAVFVSLSARVGGVRREQRFAALRLAGATRWQTAVLASSEAAGAALAGIVLGGLGFLAVRPVVAARVTLGHGTHIFPTDVRPPVLAAVIALFAVLLLVVATTLVTLGVAWRSPLERVRRGDPSPWRLLPLGAGIAAIWLLPKSSDGPGLGVLVFLALLSIGAGLLLSGPLAVRRLSRGLARVSRRATTLMAARRMAADPYTTFRSVSGAVLALYVATVIGLIGVGEAPGGTRVLRDGVVAVHVNGAPAEGLAPLLSTGALAARVTPGGDIALPCADLARITTLTCPFPVYAEAPTGNADYLALEDVFTLPHPDAAGSDQLFTPNGFAEPGPDAAALPIQTLFIPTDGSPAAQERIRTLASVTVPGARSKINDDIPARTTTAPASGLETMLPYAMIFVLLVAACSLTLSVINGVLERRHPLALLRAAGVELRELRVLVLLEIGIPLTAGALGAVLLALATTYATVPPAAWVPPSGAFLAGLAIGAFAALAVSLIALPFTNVATRYETVSFR